MPSFNQEQLQYNVRNANLVSVMIGDVIVAYAQSTTPSLDFGAQQLYGVGSANPQEIQQLRLSPEIALTAFELTDKGVTALGYPATYDTVLANNQFDIHLMSADGVTTSTYVGCVASNFSKSVATNSPITDTITFFAMDVLDKKGQSIMNGQNSFNTSFLRGPNA